MASPPRLFCSLALLALGSFASSAPAATWRIDPNSTDANRDGSSWDKAFHSYQELLDSSFEVLEDDQIWFADMTIATGTLAGDALDLLDKVAYYGGFTGAGEGEEDEPSDRRIDAGHTAVTRTIVDGIGTGEPAVIASCHEGETRFDGFFVTRGGIAPAVAGGGGLRVLNSSLQVLNCIFQENEADSPTSQSVAGGAIYVQNRATDSCGTMTFPNRRTRILNCSFVCNGASAGAQGGAVAIDSDWRVEVANSVFIHNRAASAQQPDPFGRGGAIAIYPGDSILIEGEGTPETSDDVWIANVDVVNCTFALNEADGPGGAIHVRQGGDHDETIQGPNVRIVNSIFTGSAAGACGTSCIGTVDVAVTRIGGQLPDAADLLVDHDAMAVLWPGATQSTTQTATYRQCIPAHCDDLLEDAPSGNAIPILHLADRASGINDEIIDAGFNGFVPYDERDVDGDQDASERLPDRDWRDRLMSFPLNIPVRVDLGAYE